MSLHRSSRTKRPKNLEVIDISSDDEEVCIPKKRKWVAKKPVESTNSSSKEISQPKAGIKSNETNKTDENTTPNVDYELDGQCSQAANTKIQGRSSFWARRKVWSIDELLAETANIEPKAAHNIIELFENENTIPFICRYRRDLVGHLEPDQLRNIKSSYTEIVNLRKKAENIVKQLEKDNVVDDDLRTEMLSAKNDEELEFMYAPYKPERKGTLAERAKALGLEEYADRLLFGELPKVFARPLVDKTNPNMNTEQKVTDGICNIISHKISKHTGVLEELRRLLKVHCVLLQTSKVKDVTSKRKNDTSSASTSANSHGNKKSDASKFENYYKFESNISRLKPYQILAINRAEKLKFISVKITFDDLVRTNILSYAYKIFMQEGEKYDYRDQVFSTSFEECFTKKLRPLMTRQIRSNLNEAAKKAAINVFAKNIRQLLLVPPLKGERILGLDPGFTHGCKYAAITETAGVLETGVLYPFNTRNSFPEECGEKLARILHRHKINIIALGNGTACRETELWLSKQFESGVLNSSTVRYTIVNENGASIYSCSAVAKKEFPKMDKNEISAVSIARRLNDPLSEYVKIEPRHIGVGMYQHDINEKQLNESLSEVASECVSYVGVDVNTASIEVLKHIAGLTEKKAENVIKYRLENGPIKTRKDILKIKSIGEKTFVQCAGFIRIEPRSLGGTIKNLLDCTWVHPESYTLAEEIISNCKLKLKDIGSTDFIQKIGDYKNLNSMDDLAIKFKTPKERLEVVFEALQRELFKDYRSDSDKKPFFKQGVTKLKQLSLGDILTGAVINMTDFGVFVDVGVECDGLMYYNNMSDTQISVGDRVKVSVSKIDINRKRIGLRLVDIEN